MKKIQIPASEGSFLMVTALLTYVLSVWLFPATLHNTEAEGFFACVPDFIGSSLHQPAGAGHVATAFLIQFFRWPWAGAALLTGLHLLCAGASLSLLRRNRSFPLGAIYTLFIYIALAVFQFAVLWAAWTAAVVQTFAALYAATSRRWMRQALLLLVPAGYLLVAEPALLLLGAELLFMEVFLFRCRTNGILAAVVWLLSAALPALWSTQVAFVPPAVRYTGGATDTLPAWLYIALAIPVAGLALHRRKPYHRPTRMLQWLGLAIAVAAPLLLLTNEEQRKQEQFFALEQAAEAADWEQVLRLTEGSDFNADPMSLRYALLAESGRGTLPERWLSYPITQPEQFLFRHIFTPKTCLFNALFYKNLQQPDEAFHQAFEGGVLSPQGRSMRSIRQQTDAALEAGERQLARQYMALLERTATHSRWLSERYDRLQRLPVQPQQTDSIPARSRNFAGALPLDAEWVNALEHDPSNRKLLDYLLCTFLLQKRPEKFARLMELNPQYAGQPLPAPYAQALALFADSRPQWKEKFLIPMETVQEWRRCLHLQQEGRMDELARQCAGTYWYYLFFR